MSEKRAASPASFSHDAASLAAIKADLRHRTLTARDQLRASYRQEQSARLTEFVDCVGGASGRVVSGFWPIRSEISPLGLMSALRRRGAQLCLPVVVDKTTIVFRAFDDEEALVDAGFGTKGPPSDAAVVDPDIMLIPLSVFDAYGGRIGYGAGHYDRAIMRLHEKGRSPLKVGIAFGLQEVPQVPQEAHDIPLDLVITPEGPISPEPLPSP
ncbi:MAG: 5-formyltetrahydrofolate cyclo-ligase [Pseudomonadota bacterium]